MGQQQLLLLVLATVIVGIAIAVGIVAFRQNSVRSNHDALVQDAIRIANDAQAWKQKPQMFGGQLDQYKNDLDNFTGALLTKFGYNTEAAAGCFGNANGFYEITPGATNVVIMGGQQPYKNFVEITVTGILDTDISLTDFYIGGVDSMGTAASPSGKMTACGTNVADPT